ncbi:hypothetical protein [Microlunatus parietis]|uniref:Putative TIM-barrel fold metal-dependent hydrolase n=1 Tax=Microlunatus parietis TaxID=682979 RepID=A0A7Y9IBG5_9ACTN|nr:hypothetical protein [Microlunatus parietis]NYE73219.1 putative TIM-barrel fold metal-dependent hydrolase [Microlunatus parietis]
MKSIRYDLEALHAESRFAGTVAAVHVQAAVGTPDPVLETEWLTELAGTGPIPLLIVAAWHGSPPGDCCSTSTAPGRT